MTASRHDHDTEEPTSSVIVHINQTQSGSSGGGGDSSDGDISFFGACVSVLTILKSAKAWGIILYIITLMSFYMFGFRMEMIFDKEYATVMIPLLILFPIIWISIMISMFINEYRSNNEIIRAHLIRISNDILNPPNDDQAIVEGLVNAVTDVSHGMATVTSVLSDVSNALNNAPQSAFIRMLVKRHVMELPLYLIIPIARFKSQIATSSSSNQARDVAIEGLRSDLAEKSKTFIKSVCDDAKGLLTDEGRRVLIDTVNDASLFYMNMITQTVNDPLEMHIPRICSDWENRSEEKFIKTLDQFIVARPLNRSTSSVGSGW